MKKPAFLFILLFSWYSATCQKKETISLRYDKSIPGAVFGAQQLQNAFLSQGIATTENVAPASGFTLRFLIDPKALGTEAYTIKKNGNILTITGGDATGAMYGAVELSDQIRLGKKVQDIQPFAGKPYMPKRGIKFNIPLDARTPSYDDRGDAAQNAIAQMWEFDYWKNFLDNMARYRYNVLSLWIPHPFPSMVKVPEYPDVALNDVCMYTGKVTLRTRREWNTPDDDIQNPEKLKVIKKITIDEKIAHWKKVFNYAQDRGIEIHLYTWNVFVYGAEGKHGITWKQDNPITIDYMRKSVKQFLLTYPNVKAIGVTAGEHVDARVDPKYRIENFLGMTYGQGIMDAKAINPRLDVTLIFRQHHTSMEDIRNSFKDYKGKFETEFKYSRARVYSSVSPPFFDSIYRADVAKNNMKCWMNVRNDDVMILRWGDPLYASQYIKNMPYDLTAGFVMGGDGYVYGKDFASKNPAVAGQYEIDKHWFSFMIWGRAAYDPNLPESFYKDQLKLRFPQTDANKLYATWRNTSGVISWVDKLFFGPNDHEFSFEGSYRGHSETHAGAFISINDMISKGGLPVQGVIPIADYANNPESKGINPFEVADKIEAAANLLLEGSGSIPSNNNAALSETLGDFKAWGHLGRYYAAKFRGATWTAMLRNTGNEEYRTKAVTALTNALAEWKNYAEISEKMYKTQVMARLGKLEYSAVIPNVEKDIEIARNAKKGEPVRMLNNNKLWEIKSKIY